MNIFKRLAFESNRLWEAMFGPTPPDVLNDSIVAVAIAKYLCIDMLARDAGSRDEPKADDTEPDANEQSIHIAHLAWHLELNEGYGEQVRALHNELATHSARLSTRWLEAPYRKAVGDIALTRADFQAMLVGDRKHERLTERELRDFKAANTLNRLPRKAVPKKVVYSVLGGTWLGESGLNAWTFAKGSAGGLLGGLIEASAFAGVNLAVAYVVGVAALTPPRGSSSPPRSSWQATVCF